jgi:hypothetical protein
MRDDASWLALTNIGSGRYVPFSENPPGQPVALECPECPRGGVRPAAEFVRQFCLRRQLGPRRVFAAPDPPREHGVNVLVGPRVLPRIIHDQSHGQCNDPSPDGLLVFHLEHPRVAAPTDVYARVTPSPGRRQMSALGQGYGTALSARLAMQGHACKLVVLVEPGSGPQPGVKRYAASLPLSCSSPSPQPLDRGQHRLADQIRPHHHHHHHHRRCRIIGIQADPPPPQPPPRGHAKPSNRSPEPADKGSNVARLTRLASIEDVVPKWIRYALDPASSVTVRAEPGGATTRMQHLVATLHDMVCEAPRVRNRRPKPA